ncbi:MAG: CPBP family intramembrane metalloprotease [Bacteroidales bacterium]|nr:MAG: CPBP family intramembrane metalloprotease [Bacteroidales bacterium]
MTAGLIQNATPFTKLLFSVVIIIGSFLAFLFLAGLLAIPVFGLGTEELISVLENLNQAEDVRIMKYFQIWLSVGSFLVPSFIIAYFISSSSIKYLKLNKLAKTTSFFFVVLVMLVALPVINLLARWNAELDLPGFLDGMESKMREMEEAAKHLTDTFLAASSGWQFMANVFVVAIIPAFGEEFLFRGIIQRLFSEWTKNVHVGVVIAAIIFSTFHLQFFGFLPRLLMGVFFGYLLVWSGSMWLPVLAHFINNGLAVIVYFFYGKEFVERDLDTLGTGSEGFMIMLACSLFTAVLIWFIYRTEKASLE